MTTVEEPRFRIIRWYVIALVLSFIISIGPLTLVVLLNPGRFEAIVDRSFPPVNEEVSPKVLEILQEGQAVGKRQFVFQWVFRSVSGFLAFLLAGVFILIGKRRALLNSNDITVMLTLWLAYGIGATVYALQL